MGQAATETPAKKVVKKVTGGEKANSKPTENKAKPKPAENKSRGAPTGPRAAPEGYTSLADICKKLKIEPTAARRKLRASDITVEARAWNFKTGSKDEKKVIDLLSATD